MKFKKCLSFLFMALLTGVLCFSIRVNAININGNDVIYFVDTNEWGDPYIYMYSSSEGEAFSWQDSKGIMTDTGIDVDGRNLYAYTVDSSYGNKYDMIVFSSKNTGKQTKDLNYVRHNVMFAPYTTAQSDGKYDGEWYIKDKSSLSNLVGEAEALDSNMYTAASYSNLSTALIRANEILNTTYVLVGYYGESDYDTVVTDLQTAIDSLVVKNKVNLATVSGGNITIDNAYFEDNEAIEFNVTPLTGFDVTTITVTKVTGYNGDVPVLSSDPADITTLTVNANGRYSYNTATDDVYINAVFSKKIYNITTTVGELGNITPSGPVTVEHGDSKDFVITAREGYNIKSVVVNGVEYTLQNGTLSLNNITGDMNIVVTFEIKTYIVNIDGVDYQVTHGSKLSDLSNYNSIIAKDNYTFEGFKVVGTDEFFDTNETIDSNIRLTTVFTKNTQDDVVERKDSLGVPNTLDTIVISFVGLGISVLVMFGVVYYKKKKMN